MKMVSCKVTTIENKMVYCKLDILMKTVSCKVMTIENQHGYWGIRGALENGSRCRGCWGHQGVYRCQGCIVGLAGSVVFRDQQGYRGNLGALGLLGL